MLLRVMHYIKKFTRMLLRENDFLTRYIRVIIVENVNTKQSWLNRKTEDRFIS